MKCSSATLRFGIKTFMSANEEDEADALALQEEVHRPIRTATSEIELKRPAWSAELYSRAWRAARDVLDCSLNHTALIKENICSNLASCPSPHHLLTTPIRSATTSASTHLAHPTKISTPSPSLTSNKTPASAPSL